MSAPRITFVVLAASLLSVTATFASRYPYAPKPNIVPDAKDALAGEYKLDPAHTSVTMRLSHMGLSHYTIRFNGVQGHYAYDPARPTASKIEVNIDPNSIDTGNPKFNTMISKEFFESDKFPSISFSSNAIRAVGNHGAVEGVLTLHGVNRPLSLDVSYNGYKNQEEPHRMGFSATTTLKRSDFDVDAYAPIESDQVDVIIEAEFIKAQS